MYKTIGHPVMKLRRVSIGPLSDSTLEAGQWRDLTDQEVRRLMAEEEPVRPKRQPRKTAAPSAVKARPSRGTASKKPAAKRAAAPKKKKATRSRSRSS
jgi:topoisomerase IA-like protein